MLCKSWGPFHIVKFALECILGGFLEVSSVLKTKVATFCKCTI